MAKTKKSLEQMKREVEEIDRKAFEAFCDDSYWHPVNGHHERELRSATIWFGHGTGGYQCQVVAKFVGGGTAPLPVREKAIDAKKDAWKFYRAVLLRHELATK